MNVTELNGCDALLLSLIIDGAGISTLNVRDDMLATVLENAFVKAERLSPPNINVEDKADLILTRFEDAFNAHEEPQSLMLVHAIPEELPLPSKENKHQLWMRPLAFLAPIAWSSRMAWLAVPHTRKKTEMIQHHLANVLGCDEFDPLLLHDEIRSGGASNTTLAHGSRKEYCLELEQRIRELETSGLVRYRSLLEQAARRRRLST